MYTTPELVQFFNKKCFLMQHKENEVKRRLCCFCVIVDVWYCIKSQNVVKSNNMDKEP